MGSHIKNKDIRQYFYCDLKQYGTVKIEGWVNNVVEVDIEEYMNNVNAVKPAPSQ